MLRSLGSSIVADKGFFMTDVVINEWTVSICSEVIFLRKPSTRHIVCSKFKRFVVMASVNHNVSVLEKQARDKSDQLNVSPQPTLILKFPY